MVRLTTEWIVAFLIIAIFTGLLLHVATRPGVRSWISRQTQPPAAGTVSKQDSHYITKTTVLDTGWQVLARRIEEVLRTRIEEESKQADTKPYIAAIDAVLDELHIPPAPGTILLHGENMDYASAFELVQQMREARINARINEYKKDVGVWYVWSGVYVSAKAAMKSQKKIIKKGFNARLNSIS